MLMVHEINALGSIRILSLNKTNRNSRSPDLFFAQRDHRLDAHGAARRNGTSSESDEDD
jgi:hypothetical protein